jgi:uncharacterized protein (TIGR02996 family)
MADRAAFLASICAAPDDDGVRLIYADWLEEHGDGPSDRGRAEFIRVQCALEGLEKYSPQRMDLEERAADLLSRYGDDWLEDVPAWDRNRNEGASGVQYRHGFLHAVSAKPEDFIASAGEMFARTPVREAHLGPFGDAGRAVALCPELGRLASLSLFAWDTPLDLPAVLASPHLGGLRELSLQYITSHQFGRETVGHHTPILGDEEAKLLAACPQFKQLQALDVSTNQITSEGLAALIESRYLSQLERLNVRGNPINDVGLERLAHSHWCSQLTQLNLHGTNIGNGGLRALTAGRPERLARLAIGHGECRISDAGVRALARCEALAGLRELDLSEWPLNRNRVRAIAQSTHLAGLRVLHLGGTQFDDEMAEELAASPYLRNLRFLDFQRNPIGSRGIAALAPSPILDTVTDIVLYSSPQIGDEGAAALAASEHLMELRRLLFVVVGLGPAGARAIATSPNLPQLRYLDLQSHPLGDEGGMALSESPYLTRIRTLNLYTCGIGESVTAALRERFGDALHI